MAMWAGDPHTTSGEKKRNSGTVCWRGILGREKLLPLNYLLAGEEATTFTLQACHLPRRGEGRDKVDSRLRNAHISLEGIAVA